jgi:hypothetical protein
MTLAIIIFLLATAVLMLVTIPFVMMISEIHSCHADCQRFACVQTRRAVEAEREACAQMVERLGQEGYGALAIAAALRQGDKS